jgi:hypothetical protein
MAAAVGAKGVYLKRIAWRVSDIRCHFYVSIKAYRVPRYIVCGNDPSSAARPSAPDNPFKTTLTELSAAIAMNVALRGLFDTNCALTPTFTQLVGGASNLKLEPRRPSQAESHRRSGSALVLLQLLVSGICAGLPITVPLLASGAKGH